jgi:hypothetical protein
MRRPRLWRGGECGASNPVTIVTTRIGTAPSAPGGPSST